MVTPEQLNLSTRREESERIALKRATRRARQNAFMRDLDEQLEAAFLRWEKTLDGKDFHKEAADLLTDDEQHPVSTTQVYDWMARRNGRRPPAELIALAYMVDDQFAAWWNQATGWDTPKRLALLPVERENELLRAALREFGAQGETKLQKITTARPELVVDGGGSR